MGTTTVNISFKDSLLADIDKVAKLESRSRSELLREAARMYIDRKRRWGDIFAYGELQVLQENCRKLMSVPRLTHTVSKKPRAMNRQRLS